MKLVIVGNRDGSNVGGSIERAAKNLGHDILFLDAFKAMEAPKWIQRLYWHLFQKRPFRLKQFSWQTLEACRRFQPECLITTGTAPVEADVLKRIGELGIKRLNYSTDDPWNPAHQASWFIRGLKEYDYLFSTRKSNLADFKAAGCQAVSYLPFGYDPELYYPDPAMNEANKDVSGADITFIGSADSDRLPYIRALVGSGFRFDLYGSFWDRFKGLRGRSKGQIGMSKMRQVIAAAKISLCLVRRANRDGHVMRSFEIPAMRGCMLTEDTVEHREIFGEEGEAVLYFKSVDEMMEKIRRLLNNPPLRERLSERAYRIVVEGKNSYQDRLITMLDLALRAS